MVNFRQHIRIAQAAITALSLWSICWSYNLDSSTTIDKSGLTIIQAKDGNVGVTIQLETAVISFPVNDTANLRCLCLFTSNTHPCSILKKVSFSVKGKYVFIPPSIFCDIASINDGYISVCGNGRYNFIFARWRCMLFGYGADYSL